MENVALPLLLAGTGRRRQRAGGARLAGPVRRRRPRRRAPRGDVRRPAATLRHGPGPGHRAPGCSSPTSRPVRSTRSRRGGPHPARPVRPRAGHRRRPGHPRAADRRVRRPGGGAPRRRGRPDRASAWTNPVPVPAAGRRPPVRPASLVRLALAGNRTDTARVVLTALSALLATLAGLAALTVLAIPTPAGGLGGNTPSSTPTRCCASPVCAAGRRSRCCCCRAGAGAGRAVRPARRAGPGPSAGRVPAGRRHPGPGHRLVAAGDRLASLLGTLAGLVAYLVGRVLLHRPDARGLLALPTDVLPSAVGDRRGGAGPAAAGRAGRRR